jgi:hypothetical protein
LRATGPAEGLGSEQAGNPIARPNSKRGDQRMARYPG